MTFEEFLAACASAQVVSTVDGDALLIGNKVIQLRGIDLNMAAWFAKALQMVPQPAPEEPHAEV